MAEKKIYHIRNSQTSVEVNREVHYAYHSVERHLRTLNDKDKRNGKISYDNLDTEDSLGEEIIPDRDAVSVEDAAIALVMRQQLHKALRLLPESEQELIYAIYFQGLSERKLSQRMGIHYMTIHSRKVKILQKLRKLLES